LTSQNEGVVEAEIENFGRQMIIEGEIHECELNWNKTWLIENCMTQAGAFSLGFF
jgi:hypothetical protein